MGFLYYLNTYFVNINSLKNGEISAILDIIFHSLMLISSGFLIYFIIDYLRYYKIFSGIFTKLKGDVREYDRFRRKQMKAEIAANNSVYAIGSTKKRKISILTKIYSLIEQSGIIEKIPGFSEMAFIVLVMSIDIFIFAFFFYKRSFEIGLIIAGLFLIIIYYILTLFAYNRKLSVEKQLLQFINACASASMQYSNIIDIFGAIYEQFTGPLREGLLACYVEAKQYNERDIALKNLTARFNSIYFSFVIDNLELCSSVTGDYYSAARDISNTISIYNTSHEKKVTLLRNAKLNITVMFIISTGILYALGQFLGNLSNIILNTGIGNIMLISLLVIYLYGLNMKAE